VDDPTSNTQQDERIRLDPHSHTRELSVYQLPEVISGAEPCSLLDSVDTLYELRTHRQDRHETATHHHHIQQTVSIVDSTQTYREEYLHQREPGGILQCHPVYM
jgi:hypothetical protein